jgi:hypothetical protein
MIARTLDFDENALRRIVDPAAQFQLRREPENKRAEANALNRAANGEFQPRNLAVSGFSQRSNSKLSRTMSVGLTARTSVEPHLGQTSGRWWPWN